jgi:hypothetical protein
MSRERRTPMKAARIFSEVVEAVESLSEDEQESLVEIVQRRLSEKRRMKLTQEVAEARQEYAQGACEPAGPDDLLAEIRG